MNQASIITKLERKREQIDQADARSDQLRLERNELWKVARDAGITAEVMAQASGVNRSRIHQVITTPRPRKANADV